MPLLHPSQIQPAFLGVTKKLSLLMPFEEPRHPFLLVPADGKVLAITLSGEHKFNFWEEQGDNNAWTGFLVPDIDLAIDPESASVFSRQNRLGSAIRQKDSLGMFVRSSREPSNEIRPVLRGLPVGPEALSVAFSKWEITIGQGADKQSLFKFDASKD